MLKTKTLWQNKIKKDKTKNDKYDESYPILNHRYAVKSYKTHIFRRKTRKGIENPKPGGKP